MYLRMRLANLATFLIALTIGGAIRADEVTKPGQLIVIDKGSLFSEDGIRQAKEKFADLQSKTGRQVTVETLPALPEAEATKYSKIDPKDAAAVREFWRDFTQSMAKADKARGVYIVICRKPGYVEVLSDKEMRNKGFDQEKEHDLALGLLKAMRDAAKEKTETEKTAAHDKALLSAADYLTTHLPTESTDVERPNREHTNRGGVSTMTRDSGGYGIGGWVCIGIAVIGGVWLVIALIRGISGGGAPGGGGFGGGGFFSSLLGGMFGAAAGMWMYNQFFGGGSSFGRDYGSETNSADSGGVDDAGTGDFGGDAGSGGSYDGGGDFGGDAGGGGDFGGGGGDF